MSNHREILKAVQDGSMTIDTAIEKMRSGFYENIGHSRIDHDRLERNGASEVVFGQGKTVVQLRDIIRSLRGKNQDVLVTRLSADKAAELKADFPEAVYHEMARTFIIQPQAKEKTGSFICVVCAGTSDLPVAEEARITAEFYGNTVKTVYDAGVAGLHRLLAELEDIRKARVIVAVAGMEGALASVVGGLVRAPVIAVPTSVGYGASFGGITALLAMLNSCASGMSVVNIDNGFGAGYLASVINKL